jgi:A/G-specific adenine glycosylase
MDKHCLTGAKTVPAQEFRFDALLAGKERRRRLRAWSRRNGRRFPWRREQSAWPTLVAEMLLRRTRADQVAAHLPRILLKYPTPATMAETSADDVIETLKPLGLVWRARSLHNCAQMIAEDHQGKVPLEGRELMKLPGVGPYVASSVLAACGQAVVLTDTNTVRVAPERRESK